MNNFIGISALVVVGFAFWVGLSILKPDPETVWSVGLLSGVGLFSVFWSNIKRA